MLLMCLATALMWGAAVAVGLVLLHRLVLFRKRVAGELTVGFFHPYCHAGGGGERVLWVALDALKTVSARRKVRVVIYTGDTGATPADILGRAKSRFGVDLSKDVAVEFVYLKCRRWMEADRYPRFTMIGQSLGSMLLAWECLWRLVPDVWLDTTGCAFTYLVAKVLAGCRVGCYTHYPTITQDMIQRVHERRATYNNAAGVSGSVTLTNAKLLYYRVFAAAYRVAGFFSDVVMVNSSWTKAHVESLWRREATLVYPPCNTDNFKTMALGGRERVVVSVGQFRPEKDHERQIAALAQLHARSDAYKDVRLVLIGGCRNDEDMRRVDLLKALAEREGVAAHVEFKLNAPFRDLQKSLGSSLMGIHTMWNEHFGIGVVEMMAAGTIPVAHRSGGPRSDIVATDSDKTRTGFLAETPAEYASCMETVLRASPATLRTIAERGRASVDRFSDAAFKEAFAAAVAPLLR